MAGALTAFWLMFSHENSLWKTNIMIQNSEFRPVDCQRLFFLLFYALVKLYQLKIVRMLCEWSVGSLVYWNLYGTIYGTLEHWIYCLFWNVIFCFCCSFCAHWSWCGFQLWAYDYLFGFIYMFMLKFMDHRGHKSFSILDIELIPLFTWYNNWEECLHMAYTLFTVHCSYCGENCMNFKIL